MLHIVLFQPQIPQNTGNIGRLSAITKSRLHLIHPLGFEITDRHLKRSGMDYWKALDIVHHQSDEDFLNSPQKPERIWLLTTKAEKSFWEADFMDGDGLLFGNETSGCPDRLHQAMEPGHRITIPHYNQNLRSLNLSTSAGIATYEALRQIRSSLENQYT